MVPFTELHQAGTSKSGTSASTSSSLWRPLPSQTGLEHGLETDFKGVTHQLQFSQQSRGERQYLLSEALKEADGNCQMTGHPKADATHLLKKTNPDVVSAAIPDRSPLNTDISLRCISRPLEVICTRT
jgi:hypothetical protein